MFLPGFLHGIAFSAFLIPQTTVPALAETGRQSAAPQISGYSRTLLEYRRDEVSGDDTDVSSYLNLDATSLFGGDARLYFYGRVRFDLGEESSIDEALRGSDSRVFQAFLETGNLLEPVQFRVGRQWVHEVEGVHLDGILGNLELGKRVRLLAFGGRPVSPYSSRSRNSLVGAELEYRPTRSTTIRVNGVRVDENHPLVNDQFGISIRQRLGQEALFSYDQKIRNRRNLEFRLSGTYLIPSIQLETRGTYFRRVNRSPQPGRDDLESTHFSDYYLLFDQMEKAHWIDLQSTKFIGDCCALSAGFSNARIQGLESPTNRERTRLFFSLQLFKIFLKGLDIALDVNWAKAKWASAETTAFRDVDGTRELISTRAGQNDETLFITGKLEYEVFQGFRTTLGSAYGTSDFERFFETDQVLADAIPKALLYSGQGNRFVTRTYFAELDWKLHRQWRLKWLVEYDHSRVNTGSGDEDYLRTVASLGYRF